MNKFALAAAVAAALTTAAPVVAQEAPTADPFVSTQFIETFTFAGLTGPAAIAAAVAAGALTFAAIDAASDTK